MFFTPKKEEQSAVGLFRNSCVTTGLDIRVSKHALAALSAVATTPDDEETGVGVRDLLTLQRRGLVRVHNEEVIITQLGILVLTLAEAGGLVQVKGHKYKAAA